jgi:hypothetical protein
MPVLAVLTALRLACGACTYLPSSTERQVKIADIAGIYEYQYNGRTVTIHLEADGTFEIENSTRRAGHGTWYVDGADIVLNYDEPRPDTIREWYVSESFGKLEIVGGEADPDLWYFMRKVTAAP